MLNRTIVVGVTLAIAVVLIEQSACRKDQPEPAPQESRAKQDMPVLQASSPPKPASPTQKAPPPSSATTENGVMTKSSATGTTITYKPVTYSPMEEAEFMLVARWNSIRSFSAKVTTILDQAIGQQMSIRGEGRLDCLKVEGKILLRSKIFNTMLATTGNAAMPKIVGGERITQVSDGRYVHTIRVQHDGVHVTREWAEPPHIIRTGAPMVFRRLHRFEFVQLLPDDTIDGRSAFVFEGERSDGRLKTRFYVDKETGILLKKEVEKESDKTTYGYTLSELQLDTEFNEDFFIFVPPEGVAIEDLTDN